MILGRAAPAATPAPSTSDREQHFGVLRYDGTAKPAYATLKGLLAR